MKKILFLLASMASVVGISQVNTNDLSVADFLVRSIMSSPEWEDSVSTGGVDDEIVPLFQTYEDLFLIGFPSNHVGFALTPSERKAAFENFIAAIPELTTNGMYRPIATHGGVALSFCRDFGATNVLSSAMRILSDNAADSRGTIWGTALDVFEEFATPSGEMNDFAAQILTNKTPQTSVSRKYFLGAYANVLKKRRDSCGLVNFTNGIAIVKSGVYGWAGSIAVDKLLQESYPNYAISSNRLALAISALNANQPDEKYWNWSSSIHRYFVPITNQLMNAAQPLPEVEALRGL